ncbi:uncharacterized protein LOC126426855 isoform X2 [Schistocerca serialis cubense]|uniref:uncharacterized protein LOC126426855 isoform X2 n=1 Tax=Schistocerca serialis cubense TaxID=2023355 RepID=UPI00214E980A|nr:uncharacterized protein LOC126426855 isoform X2 [Schistocerca serialis cubense]
MGHLSPGESARLKSSAPAGKKCQTISTACHLAHCCLSVVSMCQELCWMRQKGWACLVDSTSFEKMLNFVIMAVGIMESKAVKLSRMLFCAVSGTASVEMGNGVDTLAIAGIRTVRGDFLRSLKCVGEWQVTRNPAAWCLRQTDFTVSKVL